MYKKLGILGLFLLLVIILILKPRVLLNLHNNILGRVVLIGVVLFFTMCNVSFMEGMDNITAYTVGEDNVDGSLNTGDTITVETKAKVAAKDKVSSKDGAKISELKDQAEQGGVDRVSIHETIQAKNPKTIPVDKSVFKSEEVNASDPTTTEPFVSSYSLF
jgi:hypothetical protein